MGKTNIQWCDFSFNPWWGCEKVSPGCTNCYADTFARRVGQNVWGKDAPRRFFGDKHWQEPHKWNRAAEKAGERHRVFCASMADVFEDRPDLASWRERLWTLIEATPSLDWLLLTKRPENVKRLAHQAGQAVGDHGRPWPSNVWLGTTVEDQQRADERIPHLLRIPAAVRFLSVEPLLGPVDLRCHLGLAPNHDDLRGEIEWVIVGGESGPDARFCHPEWVRRILHDCRAAGVPFFFKQSGRYTYGTVPESGHVPHACCITPDGKSWAVCRPQRGGLAVLGPDDGAWRDVTELPKGIVEWKRAQDPKGGDPAEWPADLRVREFPKAGGAC